MESVFEHIFCLCVFPNGKIRTGVKRVIIIKKIPVCFWHCYFSLRECCVRACPRPPHFCMSVWLNVCPAFSRSRKFHINCTFPQNRAVKAMSSAGGWKMPKRAGSMLHEILQIQMLTGIKLGRNTMLDETNCRWRYHMRFIWHDTVGRVCEFSLVQTHDCSLIHCQFIDHCKLYVTSLYKPWNITTLHLLLN